jgi:hypothetical protein
MAIEKTGGAKPGDDQEQPKHLGDEQEAALKKLVPVDEPKGDAKGESKKEPDKETVMLVSGLYMGLFGLASARLGEHWALTGDESAGLALATVAVLDKYLPGMKVGVEATLVAAVVVIVMPRVMASLQNGKVVDEKGEPDGGDKSEHKEA